jgi:hypothetical protein
MISLKTAADVTLAATAAKIYAFFYILIIICHKK